MTDERYREWKSEIASARAEGDTKRLNSLQLDYNLELGECLAHQSQRTKDIKDELCDVRKNLGNVNTAVTLMDSRLGTLEAAVIRTADNVSVLAKSVQELVSYRDGLVLKHEGAKIAGRTLKAVVLGAVAVVGWLYAVYQAVAAFIGK